MYLLTLRMLACMIFWEIAEQREKGILLIVGRFVLENNWEIIIREFMKSKTQHDLLIICNHEGVLILKELKKRETGLTRTLGLSLWDCLWSGTLLKYIRNQALPLLAWPQSVELILDSWKLWLRLMPIWFGCGFQSSSSSGTALWRKGQLAQLIDKVDVQRFFWARSGSQKLWKLRLGKIVGEYENYFYHESDH